MNRATFDYFFRPSSVAVIGASSNRLKVGGVVLANIINDGYKGKIYPINPTTQEILGLKSYPSVLDVKEPIEMAVVVVPAKSVPSVMEDCGKKRIKGVVIISSGFAEAGSDGMALQEKIVEIARKYKIRIIGPNCLGIISTHSRLNASFGIPTRRRGNIAFVSQSGALAEGILGWAQDMGIGFSIYVSIGNKADVDEAELIEYLKDDKDTRVVCLYVEGISEGRKFIDSAQKASSLKPIIVIKGGMTDSGARAAASHTGSLAGSSQIYDAAFRKAGVVRVDSLEALMDAAKVLSSQRPARGDRVVIVTDAGGVGILAADSCELLGLSVPPVSSSVQEEIMKYIPPFGSARNPIDITGAGTPLEHAAMFEHVVKVVRENALADILLLCTEGSHPRELMEANRDVMLRIASKLEMPVVVSWLGAESSLRECHEEIERAANVPVFLTPERAARACSILASYGRYLYA